jgi:hypothetical protein
VLIGTSHYDHLAPIPAAAANVTDLDGILTGPGGAFITGHCAIVIDPERTEMGRVVSRAAREATGVLLVYYTGHGLLDRRGRLHLTVPGSDPDDIRWTTVPFETLREEILDSPARTKILILDCCFAGRAFEAMADVPGLVAGQTDLRGTYTIASCSANEPSFAPAGHRHTAFTGALLTANIATPGSTLDELYRETDRHLQRNGYPRPQRRNIDIAGELRLFGLPSGAAVSSVLATTPTITDPDPAFEHTEPVPVASKSFSLPPRERHQPLFGVFLVILIVGVGLVVGIPLLARIMDPPEQQHPQQLPCPSGAVSCTYGSATTLP